jgi:hypothetical protein
MKKINKTSMVFNAFCLLSLLTVSIVYAVSLNNNGTEQFVCDKNIVELWERYFANPCASGNGLVTLDACIDTTVAYYKKSPVYEQFCQNLASLKGFAEPQKIASMLHDFSCALNTEIPAELKNIFAQKLACDGLNRISERCAFALFMDFVDPSKDSKELYWSVFAPKVVSLLSKIEKYKPLCADLTKILEKKDTSIRGVGDVLLPHFTAPTRGAPVREQLLPEELVNQVAKMGKIKMAFLLKRRLSA